MATTDAKPGFRLPWSAERSQPDAPDAPAETTGDVPASEALSHDQEIETPPMIDASHTATEQTTTDDEGSTVTPTVDEGSTVSEIVAEEPQPTDAAEELVPSHDPISNNRRKPNKFMADLTRAMQGAAETAKADTLARFGADAKAHIETIHAATAVEATELRKQADDDVASVREWSKAEIARIREETDERITHRKARLEREIEAHAADIEGRIERVQRRVDAFEAEMAAFFERLLAEEDATRFAAMAESLPEPPPFDTEAFDGGPVATTSYAETADQPAERSVVVEPWPDAPAEAVAETAEAVAETPATEVFGPTTDAFDTESVGYSLGERIGESFNGTVTTVAEPTTDETPAEAETAVSEATEAEATEPEAFEPVAEAEVTETEAVDPRLDALGLSPNFEAAEAEAAAFTPEENTVDEEIPVIADDALAARIAGLVPDVETAGTESNTTRVVVTGLVSVASIAGFKRQLSRVPGVVSVGVSSGPDGEFLFAVTHDAEIVLRDAVTTLPGFGARVTAEAPGELTVTARDPESEG
jgi:hypothetical protein